MITALVGRKRRLLFITPASVKQWQLLVIMQKRNWGKPAKNKTLLPPFPSTTSYLLSCSSNYQRVLLISLCWRYTKARLGNMAILSLSFCLSLNKDNSCYKWETPQNDISACKKRQTGAFSEISPSRNLFQRWKELAVGRVTSEDASRFPDMIASL